MNFVQMTISNRRVVFGRGSNHAPLTETSGRQQPMNVVKAQRDYNAQLVRAMTCILFPSDARIRLQVGFVWTMRTSWGAGATCFLKNCMYKIIIRIINIVHQ